jgi:hypothetical protein
MTRGHTACRPQPEGDLLVARRGPPPSQHREAPRRLADRPVYRAGPRACSSPEGLGGKTERREAELLQQR